jgi:hypothetical protein
MAVCVDREDKADHVAQCRGHHYIPLSLALPSRKPLSSSNSFGRLGRTLIELAIEFLWTDCLMEVTLETPLAEAKPETLAHRGSPDWTRLSIVKAADLTLKSSLLRNQVRCIEKPEHQLPLAEFG